MSTILCKIMVYIPVLVYNILIFCVFTKNNYYFHCFNNEASSKVSYTIREFSQNKSNYVCN